jgi:hypothetical protein
MTVFVASALTLLIVAGCMLLVCATWRFAEMVWRRDAASRLIAGTEAFLTAQAEAESRPQA